MEKLKSTFTNMALALTLVAVFAGGLLAWVNNMTQGPKGAGGEDPYRRYRFGYG